MKVSAKVSVWYSNCFTSFVLVLLMSCLLMSSPLYASDTQPPTKPGNLTAVSVLPFQVKLSWSASSDDTGVTGYKIYRDGQEHAAAVSTIFTDTDLIPSSTYSYSVAAYDTEGNISEKSLAYTVSTPVNSLVPVSACGYLDKANTTYVLQNDVSSAGTCFAVIAQNVVLDLNGHTVTYDNGAPVTVANGDFESATGTSASGWDLSSAPNAQRAAGTYIQPVSVYSGSHAVKFSVPAGDQYLRSTVPVALEPNTTYSLSGKVYNRVNDSISLSIELDGTTVKAGKTGQTWRGFQYINARFTTGSIVETRTILVRLAGASGATAGSVYVDDIKIQRHKVAGVVVGPASWRVPNIVSDVTRYGNAPGVIIRNGKIVQGQGASDYSHAVSFEESSGKDFVIRDLEIRVHGANSKVVSSYNATNARIHDNVIYHDTKTITSRDSFDGAAVKIEYPASGSYFYNNTFLTGIQTALYASSKVGDVPNRVYGNTISLQTMYTNDFAIVSGGSLIYENIIVCGTGNNSCRGIAGGINTKIYNNTVSVQQLPRNQEYDGCEAYGAYGIQSESGSNIEVYGNTVTAYAGECEAHAFRANPFDDGKTMGENNSIHDNTFIALASGTARASAVKIADADATSLDIRNNILVSNSQWLHFDGHAVGLVFTGNTFKTAASLDSQFYPLTDYNWNKTLYPESVKFLDNRYPDSATAASFTAASVRNGSVNDPYASYLYAWPLTVQVKDEQGQSVPAALVEINDKDGNLVFSGPTDSAGMVSAVLNEYINNGGSKNSLNPYSVKVTWKDVSNSQQVTMDANKTFVIATSADSIAPSVSIVSPVDKSSHSGKMVVVDATASDNVGVVKVDLHMNGKHVSSASAAPFTFDLDTTELASGSYTLSARAYDAAGNEGQSSNVTVSLFNDTTPPTVAITSPSSGTTASGVVTVNASASDNLAVAKVEFFVNNILLVSDATAPFSFNWNTSSMADGDYQLSAKAYDSAGNVGQSSGVLVKVKNTLVDTVAPLVSISAPTTGARIGNQVVVAASAADNSGVTKMQVYFDNVLRFETNSNNFSTKISFNGIVKGSHVFLVKAFDAAGNVGQKTVTVNR
ncbi:MAG: hypothetical protein EG822_14190 [Deltaproteobacteria bacterium]|nr:hypothetical protein [Deltaproteobacteria bacterium]TLN03583.1 MAG: hypothetical protein FDZ73_06785 [bacterium]